MGAASNIAFTRKGVSGKTFDRKEVDAAFQTLWQVGCVLEDWDAWLRGYVPDVDYLDYFWGPLKGRAEVELWINAVMKGVPEIYTVLDWYAIENDLITVHMQNRRDNPAFGQAGETGPAYWDFPGLSILRYAGDGLFASEEDYWDRSGAKKTSIEYAAACERAGAVSAELRMLRRHWPAGPAFARTNEQPRPSWLKHADLPAITKPSELRALLGRA